MALDFAAILADRLDPPDPPVFEALGYEPNCKVRHDARQRGDRILPEPCGQCPQELFHSATEFDLLFGGSSGGGKTRALTCEALRACMRHPGIRVGAFRRTYAELKESLLSELADMNYAAELGASWNGSEFELRFPNGSLIMFRYAETIKDATRRQGGQYQLLVFDERTLTGADVISFLESRLRSGRADIPVLGIRSSANPGGASHGAVKARYIVPTNYGKRTYIDERGRSVRFIPSRLDDNPHVNAEYARDLHALPPKMRAAFLDGNWDVFAGQVFPELTQERHVVAPFTLPPTWQRFMGVDWGFAKQWACLWAAIDEDGRAWFYREIYQAGVGEADQARRILAAEAENEHIAVRYSDDSMFATRGDAKPISQIYAEEGCHLTPAGKGPGSRVTGWQRIRSYLAEAPACPHHRSMGWDTCPMLHMFSTLEDFYRTLSDLPHATRGDPEDAETTGEDHLPDAARYLLINLGTGPEFLALDEPVSSLAAELGPYTTRGNFAYRPDEREPSWGAGDDEDHSMRGRVQASPFG
jgi:terminase large subunit-like protein